MPSRDKGFLLRSHPDIIRTTGPDRLVMVVIFLSLTFRFPLPAQQDIPDSAKARQFQLSGDHLFAQSAYDSSMICYSKARDLYEKNGSWGRYEECDISMADILVRKARYKEALEQLQGSLTTAQARSGSDNIAIGQIHNLLGYILYYKQDYNPAIAHLKEALRIRLGIRGQNHPEVGYSYYSLGLAYRATGNVDEALLATTKALRISEFDHDSGNIALNLLAMANIISDRGDYDSATSFTNKALNILSRLGKKDSELAAACDFALARDLIKLNQFTRALTQLRQSLATYKVIFGEAHPAISACYMKFGELYSLKADFDNAIAFYELARGIMIKINGERHSGLAELYSFLSDLYVRKNELDRAQSFAERSFQIQEENFGDEHLATARSLEHLAQVYRGRRNYKASLETYQRALRITARVSGPDSILMAELYLSIGGVYTEANEFDRAKHYLERALAISIESGPPDSTFIASIQKAYGDMLFANNGLLSALEHYRRATQYLSIHTTDTRSQVIVVGIRPGSEILSIDLALAEAKVYESEYERSHDLRDLEAAYSDCEAAINLISKLRRSYKAEGSKSFLGEERFGVYRNGVRLALKIYYKTGNYAYKEKAYECAEKAKSNILIDRILESEAMHFSDVPDNIIERETTLRSSLTLQGNQIQKALKSKDTTEAKRWEGRYFLTNLEYDGLLDTLEAAYPRYYELKFRDDPVNVAKIQHLLQPKTAIVEYFFLDSALCAFTISQAAFDVMVIRHPAKIKLTVSLLRRSLRTYDEREYVRTSSQLFDLILRPLNNNLSHKNLVVIPDGELFYIPFEALLSESVKPGAPADHRRLPYLVRNHAISYSYSATLSLRRRPKINVPKERGFVGFAPVFNDSAKNNLVSAPIASLKPVSDGLSAMRSISIDGQKFNELPQSKAEITDIAELFRRKNLPESTYLYRDASKEHFKQSVRNYAYIHVASHGYADEEHPDLSGLVFSQPSDIAREENIVLTTNETYDLNLNADLVVLSSCESGLGRIVKGEGMMAITRGFFYSGARNILFSLWKVDDKRTRDLMTRFYTHLLSGEAMATALQHAKLEMIGTEEKVFPSMWTGFVLLSTN